MLHILQPPKLQQPEAQMQHRYPAVRTFQCSRQLPRSHRHQQSTILQQVSSAQSGTRRVSSRLWAPGLLRNQQPGSLRACVVRLSGEVHGSARRCARLVARGGCAPATAPRKRIAAVLDLVFSCMALARRSVRRVVQVPTQTLPCWRQLSTISPGSHFRQSSEGLLQRGHISEMR